MKQEYLLVHMQKREAEGLDMGQGGAKFADHFSGTYDQEELKLRDYSGWSELIKQPDIEELFKSLTADEREDGDLDPPFTDMYAQVEDSIPEWSPAPGDANPFIKELAEKGRNGDDIMVWMPSDVAKFFGKVRGGLSENPTTGLLEFFFKKIFKEISRPFQQVAKKIPEIIRVGGTLAGAYFGGPLGAGVGNALGSWATGKSFGDSAMSGLKNGALMYGVQNALPSAVNMGVPGAATASGMMGTSPSFGMGTAQGAPWSSRILNSNSVMHTPGESGGFGGMGGFGNQALMAAGMGLLKHASDKKSYENSMKDREQLRREYWEDYDRLNPKIYDPNRKVKRMVANPKYASESDRSGRGRITENPYIESEEAYAQGGHVNHDSMHLPIKETFESYIKGSGKGQADDIHTRVPPNSYFVDASTISMSGDGNTPAGVKEWDDWEERMMRRAPKVQLPKDNRMRGVMEISRVPVAVSSGEKCLNPQVVQAVGGGNMNRGSKILDITIENIRKDKSRNKGGLPPKMKPIESYMPRTVR